MAKQTTYNVGIYVRLSQEDERAGESLLLRQAYENHRKYGGFLFCTRFLHDCSYILNKKTAASDHSETAEILPI